MSKVSCNIIKDLLPSYMENICSEDTKEFVDLHLKECKDCNTLVKIMQKTELVSDQTDQKMADSMKKVKKHVQKIIGFGVLLGVIGIGTAVSAEYFGAVPIWFYYLVMPVFLAALHGILLDYKEKQAEEKRKNGFYIVTAVIVGYSILLEFLCIEWIQKGIYPFGLEENRIGVFLSNQFWLSIIIQGILAAAMIWIVVKKGILYQGVIDGCILGVCINFVFLSLLRRMDTIEHFITIRNQTLAVILLEWILTVGFLRILSLFCKKNF